VTLRSLVPSLLPVASTERPPALVRASRRPSVVALAAAIVLSTAPLATHARARHPKPEIVSGAPAPSLSEGGHPKRWKQRDLTVEIDPSVDLLGARSAVEAAFDAWSATDANLPAIRFVAGSGRAAALQADGHNTVTVAPIDVPGRETALGITVLYTDSESGEILEADVIINARKSLALLDPQAEALEASPDALVRPRAEAIAAEPDREIPSCNGQGRQGATCDYAYDVQSIVTHEAGHFLGLGEDQEDSLATTYFCTSRCETHKRTLAQADAVAAVEQYAAGFDDGPEVQCATSGAARAVATWPGSLLGLVLLLGLRRRAVR
jgi:hypothetical protein